MNDSTKNLMEKFNELSPTKAKSARVHEGSMRPYVCITVPVTDAVIEFCEQFYGQNSTKMFGDVPVTFLGGEIDQWNPETEKREIVRTKMTMEIRISELIKAGKVEHKICPKPNCFNMLNPEEVMNALSRREGVGYICSPCGTREAMEDFANRPK